MLGAEQVSIIRLNNDREDPSSLLLAGLGDYIVCQGWNPGRPCAGNTPIHCAVAPVPELVLRKVEDERMKHRHL